MIVTDHTESTCPDSTCNFRNIFGNCTLNTCVYSQMLTNVVPEVETNITCSLCKYDLDDEDYLYKEYSQDGAIVFEEIICHYCPVCGRKLTRR